jgi:hypothetical protein
MSSEPDGPQNIDFVEKSRARVALPGFSTPKKLSSSIGRNSPVLTRWTGAAEPRPQPDRSIALYGVQFRQLSRGKFNAGSGGVDPIDVHLGVQATGIEPIQHLHAGSAGPGQGQKIDIAIQQPEHDGCVPEGIERSGLPKIGLIPIGADQYR